MLLVMFKGGFRGETLTYLQFGLDLLSVAFVRNNQHEVLPRRYFDSETGRSPAPGSAGTVDCLAAALHVWSRRMYTDVSMIRQKRGGKGPCVSRNAECKPRCF